LYNLRIKSQICRSGEKSQKLHSVYLVWLMQIARPVSFLSRMKQLLVILDAKGEVATLREGERGGVWEQGAEVHISS